MTKTTNYFFFGDDAPTTTKKKTNRKRIRNGKLCYSRKEDVWDILQKVMAEYTCDKIASIYIHHRQMANAVTTCNGGVEFHSKACHALHCNVQKMDVPIFETEESEKPCGVEVM